MIIIESQFRIIPDPKSAKLCAYEILAHDHLEPIVDGFVSAKAARKAYDAV